MKTDTRALANAHAQALATHEAADAQIMEAVLTKGDLAALSASQRVDYYMALCRSLDVNPLTKPVEFLKFRSGPTIAYVTAGGIAQMRKRQHVDIETTEAVIQGDYCVVRATATTPDGRRDQATGRLHIKGLQGQELADAMMKCETKAKRRVTISILGLSGIVDAESGRMNVAIRDAQAETALLQEAASVALIDGPDIDQETGELLDHLEAERVAASGAPTCADCKTEIRDYKDWTASQIVDMTTHSYAVPLCGECATERKAKGTAR